MLSQILPYLYAIVGSISFVFMQIFFKMLTAVLPQPVVLSLQAFFLLIFNSSRLVSSHQYQASYKKYDHTDQTELMISKLQGDVQNDHRFDIHIKDPVVFKLMLKRLTINCLGVWVFGMALQRVPLSIANSLFNTGPIMIFFVEAYFYQKPLSKIHLLLTVIAFIGVLIIINPFEAFLIQKRQQLFDILLPLLSAVFTSLGSIFLHDLKGKIPQIVMLEYTYISQVLYFNLLTNFSAEDGSILELTNSKWKYFEPSIWDPYCVMAFALSITLAYCVNYCRIKSLFLLPPSKVVPFNYIGIILSLVIDLTLFGHKTNFLEILGILLTSVGLLSHLILELMQGKEKAKDRKNEIQKLQRLSEK